MSITGRNTGNKGSRPMLKKWDVIVISFFIMISFFPALIFYGSSEKIVGAKEIVIEKDGKEIYRESMKEEDEYLVSFPFSHAGKDYEGNLEVKDGAVRLKRLPEEIVPLSIHEEMGWIRDTHEIIVALPIKMVVTVENQAESEVDIIVK
ncbi:NusG domain II-containing protein [Proteiniclasticum sp.]|uniref:NusG domain II-containing protein n=1 Tax=Proteiniclasticum sp. TaxID=2053595 RepID=UPI00289B8635|nr:NusG domain II-containing protein [Proteiniclasticum sp.]